MVQRRLPFGDLDPAADGPVQRQARVDDIMPLLTDDDPLGVDTFATHRIALDQAPEAYRAFADKRDGHIKVQLKP
jgi:threonine dehydrogenase-like Zn-dependent dehydrogenase